MRFSFSLPLSQCRKPAIEIDTTKLKVRPTITSHVTPLPTLEVRFGSSDSEDKVDDVNEKECGIFTEEKIIGGSIAGLYDYPWTALLIYNSSELHATRLRFYSPYL